MFFKYYRDFYNYINDNYGFNNDYTVIGITDKDKNTDVIVKEKKSTEIIFKTTVKFGSEYDYDKLIVNILKFI